MSNRLGGKRVAFLATDGVEQVELTEPWKAVEQEGGQPDLISLESGEIQGFDHLDKDKTFAVDKVVAEVDAGEYDGLVLPGGVANPDFLRMDESAVRFVRAFFEAGKPVAAICNGPQILISADLVRGRTMTGWEAIQKDLANAGATVRDEPVVTDQGLVTSRKPDDIPQFNAKMIEEFAEGRHDRQRRSAA
jgi:protease I